MGGRYELKDNYAKVTRGGFTGIVPARNDTGFGYVAKGLFNVLII